MLSRDWVGVQRAVKIMKYPFFHEIICPLVTLVKDKEKSQHSLCLRVFRKIRKILLEIIFSFLYSGMLCGVSETNLVVSLIMYSSYFILFARFFYSAYFGQTKPQLRSSEKEFEEKKKTFSPGVEDVEDTPSVQFTQEVIVEKGASTGD